MSGGDAIVSVKERFRRMAHHEKLLEGCKAMLFEGDYAAIRPKDLAGPLFMLDDVNFSSALFDDPLPFFELLSLFNIEPGYSTVTGDSELGPLIRRLEQARCLACADQYGVACPEQVLGGLDRTVVVTTCGASGAADTALSAALHRNLVSKARRKDAIVFNTPCYCLPESFALSRGLRAKPICGNRASGFLPTVPQIRRAIDEQTLACFLTVPSNPALESWSGDDRHELERLINHCQMLDVVLIMDSVFQDLRWRNTPSPEIFMLAEDTSHLIKITSPSKDRPRACGYRVGYLIADSALEPWLHQAESLNKNSLATPNQVWLAFDCLFRLALLEGALVEEQFELLTGRCLFGYRSFEPSAAQMLDLVRSSGMFERYAERLRGFHESLREQILDVHGWLQQSICFEVGDPPPFGNILMVRVKPDFVLGDEIDHFIDILTRTHIAATVGGGFGLPEDEGVWFRVVVGGAPVAEILGALARVQGHLRTHAVPARPWPTSKTERQLVAGALVGVETGRDTLELSWADGQTENLLYLWLRDNCQCPRCQHPEARERTFDLLSVPGNLCSDAVSITNKGGLEILWPDRHLSRYSSKWLRALGQSPDWPSTERELWDATSAKDFPQLILEDIMDSDRGLQRMCRLLLRRGIVRVRDVPSEPAQVTRCARRLGHVWTHFFGDHFDVTTRPDADSLAYTSLRLPLHTDLPSRQTPPAYQFLHCLANEVRGGDFLCVDGFAIAAELRRESPELYLALSSTDVEHRFVGFDVDYRHRGPILQHNVDGCLRSVRFNSFLLAPLNAPLAIAREFYRAYRRVLEMTTESRFQLSLRWEPGDLVIFDNRRVLHGRTAFGSDGGIRHIQGCYLDADELASRMRIKDVHDG